MSGIIIMMTQMKLRSSGTPGKGRIVSQRVLISPHFPTRCPQSTTVTTRAEEYIENSKRAAASCFWSSFLWVGVAAVSRVLIVFLQWQAVDS